MNQKICLVMLFLSTMAHAEVEKIEINEIPITANPLSLSDDEMVRPVHILNGIELKNKRSSSLGSMLKSIPGVSNSSWGDSLGRPVIRGMDRNRIKILNNGMQVKDMSNVSGDHAISLDSLSAEQIEIVRGAETILYGGGAVGGVVNVIDYRIHSEFFEGTVGRYDISKGGANNELSSAITLDYGTNNSMFHLDLYKRDTKNLKIPGFSVSEELVNSDDEFTRSSFGKDTLQNSYNNSQGVGLGTTFFFDQGFTGISFGNNEQEYGTILEDRAHIDSKSDSYKYVLELEDLSGLINKFKFRLGYNDYSLKELEDGAVNLDFYDKGVDGKFEIVHSLLSKSAGVLGIDFGKSLFSQKKNPYEPNNKRHNIGFYALEKIALSEINFVFGFRHDYQNFKANDFTSDDGAATEGGPELSTSFTKTEKNFNVTSFSVGTNSYLNENWSLGLNVAHTERAPNHDELFVYGEHHATETIEQGDRNLKVERSHSAEITLHWTDNENTFSISPYYMDFSSYIALLDTGRVQYHEHDGETEALPVFRHQNVPAEFYGFEFQGHVSLTNNYAFNYRGDFVRAKNKNGGDLPRIPPITLGAELTYQFNALLASIDVEHNFSQTNTAPGELKTNDYTNLVFTMNYDLPYAKQISLFIKGDNLLDEEIRDHTSFLKDKVLLGERSFTFGISSSF